MFQAGGGEKTQLKILDREQIKQVLDEIRSTKPGKVNWCLLSYVPDRKNDLKLERTGSGGFEEMKGYLKDDDVKYGVFEVVVKGDDYNPVKFVLMTWVGPNVSPGLGKGRCAAHRLELYEFINSVIPIAGEFQPSDRDHLNFEAIAAKLTRIANQDATTAGREKQQMARSRVKEGDTSKSRVVFAEDIAPQLKKVHLGQLDWVVFGYSDTEKDKLLFIDAGRGGGLEKVKTFFEKDRIRFCVYAMNYKPPACVETVKKYILITMVGSNVPPLKKARSGGHRQDIADFVLQSVPFHLHFQPNDIDEITEKNIVAKLQ